MATRLGDAVIDLAVLLGDDVFTRPTLNAFLAQGHDRWRAVRREIAERVAGEIPDEAVHPVDEVTLHLPIEVADHVDSYASEHHAANLGRPSRGVARGRNLGGVGDDDGYPTRPPAGPRRTLSPWTWISFWPGADGELVGRWFARRATGGRVGRRPR